MPPHCDSLDGPVVLAAQNALESKNVDFALPFARESAESEIRTAFDKAMAVRSCGPEARLLAERWFAETLVRLHLAGEGKPFEGLQPSGLHPPIIQAAEESIRIEDSQPVTKTLVEALEATVEERFARVLRLKQHDPTDIVAARAYTTAMLAYIVWVHHAFATITAEGHEPAAPAGPKKEHGIAHLVEG